ncbi:MULTISPECIES: hypothetical protein [unclassified Sphingomonas]|uniref:hypothetical protein n=1 Tax=unclassified Sphingomonas TaxID=196159 RepID=UPI0006FD2A31|nr:MULTISPECIES: hypothetical protein [unclassified Sphingomonas]KQM58791.1 hypothetical protein ASE65_10530 [Sphingomonas sp. Leaf16]KQN11046.1 hypothetical protein ASE81_11515 [Sphingomonas sp. Leaf29]KQN18347.1 hypothetical protein ASE83_11450 [Sphingomonas sp. Leaf32]
MASLVFVNTLAESLAKGLHKLTTDALKVALTNDPMTPVKAKLADVTQIAATNGYTAGGLPVTVSASAIDGASFKVGLGDVTFTASGGAMGPFRYAVLYNDSSTDKLLIGYADYGLSYSLPASQPFVVDFDPAAAITVG